MIWIPEGAELAHLRQGLYRFFAGAMLPPDQERVDEMVAAAGLLGRVGIDAFAFASTWWQVHAELQSLQRLDELAATHVRLFEAGTDGALCPPIESYYVASPGQGGPAFVIAEVERDFLRNGSAVVHRAGLSAEHLSPQLELMALLAGREAEGREAGNIVVVSDAIDEQRGFLERHLCRWIPPFATRTTQFAPPGLYRALTAAIATFVDHDRELLHVLSPQLAAGASG